ncbi:Zinc finger transcription factor family protein 17 [Frankliniella fusca]|uniref:Zinc finger transcription factor family protein 17 n=1 Tax=Frankliniella fusca TaxID=407009 RepID=A0AAE1LF08_9NEOP|nr:Zinc finger transcription factor family protein 17 [Frankliniella fusca]
MYQRDYCIEKVYASMHINLEQLVTLSTQIVMKCCIEKINSTMNIYSKQLLSAIVRDEPTAEPSLDVREDSDESNLTRPTAEPSLDVRENSDSLNNLTRPVNQPQVLVLKCDHCPKTYASKKSLIKHKRKNHNDDERDDDCEETSEINFKCAMCYFKGPNYIRLTRHMTQSHDYDDCIEKKSFTSMEEFGAWKECMESKHLVSFVNERGVRKLVGGKKILLECHRSGYFVRKGKGVREEKKSCKIGAVCPARMEVLISDDGSVGISWHENHFGHEFDMNFMRLTSTEREMIERRLRNHESFDSILDDVRDSLTRPSDFKRIHLLEKRDLWNMLRKV